MLDHASECVDLGVTTLDIAAICGGGQAEALLGDALPCGSGCRARCKRKAWN
jgi:predicted oxidoreductase